MTSDLEEEKRLRKGNLFKSLSLGLFAVGIFALSVGAGLLFMGKGQTGDVKVISAKDYSAHEIVKPEVKAETGGGLVNVNNASSAELEALPGIGPATAVKIIDSRPYVSTEDLVIKKAIGRSLFEKIGAQLSVE